MDSPQPHNTPTTLPVTPQLPDVKDPSWWRLGCIPFIVLILVAVAADFARPALHGGGIAAGIGALLWIAAMLLLRRDFSKPEACFLGVLGLVSFAGLTVSGSLFNWVLAFLLPLFMLLIPRHQPEASGHYRTWWGFWLARRKSGAQGRWAWLRQILPTLITIFIGVALFVAFLCIFASGNPVVELVWETIRKWWNALVEWLELDWDFVWHLFAWFVGFVLFGFYTFARPGEPRPLPAMPQPEVKPGRSLLPHLPLVSLLGINLAFLIATGSDIAYLWFGRVPEGISRTVYLHDGAASITWASALASAILVFLFRRKGTARQGRVTRLLGYLLVLQTFLLAVSVYLRLFHQIADFGFTTRRIQAAEALLLGLDGLVILLCYMACSGAFWKYTRICLGSMLLLFVTFGVCPPTELAGDLNLRYAPQNPHWNFVASDFNRGRFIVKDNLAFALYVRERLPEPNELFSKRIESAAEDVESRAAAATWRNWNLSMQRDIPAAEQILGRPICPKKVEPAKEAEPAAAPEPSPAAEEVPPTVAV